ncbi:dipeptidase [Clostridiaceae bacterium 35-E11]
MNIIDLHCDTILKLMEDKEKLELKQNPFSVDIEKLSKASSLAQFFALYIDLEEAKDPLEYCLEMLDKFYIEMEKNKNEIRIARNYEEMLEHYKQGKISAFLTIEEGGALKGELYHLRNFYRLGVRLITLTWNYPNEIGYPNCTAEFTNKGLTDFGKEVVCEMNRLGMMIDVSHLSDQGFYDVAKISSKPFVASHSNARTIKDHTRNLTDPMIGTLADKGGIMGINFAKEFLGEASISKVEDMIRHIQYIHNQGGIEVIALGTDFDGISPGLEIEHMGEMYKLIDALQKSGFSEEDIEKICYKNALRVIKEVL